MFETTPDVLGRIAGADDGTYMFVEAAVAETVLVLAGTTATTDCDFCDLWEPIV